MANTLSALSIAVVDSLYEDYPALFGNSSKSVFVNALQLSLTNVIGTQVTLDQTAPDYERIMLQLIQELSHSDAWKDILTAGSGQAILRMIASGISFDQFAIERALQETYLTSASSDNSIYAGVKHLGVRPRRRLPATVQVTFTRDTTGTYLEIPVMSKFTINEVDFFNRSKITFKDTQLSVAATLHQGLVVKDTIVSDGEPFQSYTFGSGNKDASDADVLVKVGSVEWVKNQQNAWALDREAKSYLELTTSNGDMEINFGNGEYGKIPGVSETISVTWVRTLGKSGNNSASNLNVKWTDMPSGVLIAGTTTSSVSGGDDELSAKLYKKIGPNLHAANSRAVRRSDYKDLALQFSGIKDALFRGQAELAPGRRSMMNVIGVTLLKEDTLTPSQFDAFALEFKEKIGNFSMEFLRIDPTPVDVSITATIYCRAEANLEQVKAVLTKAINALFTPRRDYLGYNIYKTDITDVLNGRNIAEPDEYLEQVIEYVTLEAPTVDTLLSDHTHYARLANLTLNMSYTTRGPYTGRLDIDLPSTSV